MTLRKHFPAKDKPDLMYRGLAGSGIHRRQVLITWLCGLMILTCSFALEPARTGSPNKQFDVRFHSSNPGFPNDSFTIVNAAGDVLFDSKTSPPLKASITFCPEHLLWSPDSKTIAIEGGFPKLSVTYLFSLYGKRFVSVPVPYIEEGYDNPQIVPLKWIKGRRLILGITGPHAGKANGYSYRGRTTLYVPVNSRTCEEHYHYITDHHEKLTD